MRPQRTILFATLGLALMGCGGNSSESSNGNPGAAYAGTYRSSLTLDEGKPGTLDLDVARSGSVSGTLTVEAARAASRADGFAFTVGTLSVSGSVASDGTISLSGTDPNSGGFTVGGLLPTTTQGTGQISVSAGGQTFTGSISLGTSNSTSSLTFSAISGATISGSAFPANPYFIVSNVAGNSAVLVVPSISDTSRVLGMLIGADWTVGETVTLDGPLNAKCNLVFTEGPTDERRQWRATGGTATLLSRSATGFSVKITDAGFTSDTNADFPGAGTFKLNGTVTKG